MSASMRAVGKPIQSMKFVHEAYMLSLADVHTGESPVPATALYINDKVPKPRAEGTKALVRIKAFGLNRMDISQRNGKYPLAPGVSKVIGVEYSGVVEELGPEKGELETEEFKVGDEVFGLAYGGKSIFRCVEVLQGELQTDSNC
jgi:NADPH:quinone reductase-like Zn-dependent oxidoreductase